MTKVAVETLFTGATVPYASYSSASTSLGVLMAQQTGATADLKYVGPLPLTVARPMEVSTQIPVGITSVLPWTSDVDWVFYSDNASAAATRRIGFYEYTKSTGTWNWKGFITLTYPTVTTHIIRGFKVVKYTETTGTVAVSGTTVTGASTTWTSDGFAVGARIGFGSTNPNSITTWYEISAIASNTGLTLLTSAGTVAAGTAYVIEELRVVSLNTNTTTTNGGLFIAKGLQYATFTIAGTTIPAATTIDNVRAVYWLADAATETNTVGVGCALDSMTSLTNHQCYVLNGTTTAQIFVYNMRAALTLTAGKDSGDALVLKTGAVALTGTLSALDNGMFMTLGHGAGSGTRSLYFTTTVTSRVYRCAQNGITAASTTFLTDNMVEILPGSSTTIATSGFLNLTIYDAWNDRLIITTTGSNASRSYYTRYYTNSTPFDLAFLSDSKQFDQSSASSEETPNIAILSSAIHASWNNGIAYLSRQGTAATSSQIYAWPISAHWDFASGSNNNRVITPKITTPSIQSYYRVYVNEIGRLGGVNLGIETAAYRMFYRQIGIDDNSGAWTAVPAGNDMTGVATAGFIQFMFEFRLLGPNVIPARLNSVCLIYETADDLVSQFEWNLNDSNLANGTIGFSQTQTFGSFPIPTLTVEYWNETTQTLVLSQISTSTANGLFQYFDTGSTTWLNGTGPDTIGTRRRFVPTAGLPASVNVYCKVHF